MKIVQSYWSKPSGENSNWAHKDTHYYSWALSCLKLKQYYDKVELVTDKAGEDLLINKLKLPYDSVRIVLDDLNEYDPLFWALGKIYAYSIQKEPFIHVDGDVYIWDKFPANIEYASLIAQHEENNYEFANMYYEGIMQANSFSLPEAIIAFRKEVTKNMMQANAGILGGNDIKFIHHFCQEAFRMVDENKGIAHTIKYPGMFNTIFEQYLFYCMAYTENKNITYLFNEKINSEFKELVQFNDVPYKTHFIHLLSFYKNHISFNHQIIKHLWYEFPEYYNRVTCFIKNKNYANCRPDSIRKREEIIRI